MLVGHVEEVSVDLAGSLHIATGRTHSLHAWSGSVGVDDAATALVLATSRTSASASINGPAEPSGRGGLRDRGHEQRRSSFRRCTCLSLTAGQTH